MFFLFFSFFFFCCCFKITPRMYSYMRRETIGMRAVWMELKVWTDDEGFYYVAQCNMNFLCIHGFCLGDSKVCGVSMQSFVEGEEFCVELRGLLWSQIETNSLGRIYSLAGVVCVLWVIQMTWMQCFLIQQYIGWKTIFWWEAILTHFWEEKYELNKKY